MIKKIRAKISAWQSKRSLNKAIKRANLYAAQTGRRFYVVPMDGKGLAVVDNSFMKIYNRKAKKKINAAELVKMSLYVTPWH